MTTAPSHPDSLPVLRAGFAVSLLSGRTGLRLAGQADLTTVGLLQLLIASLAPEAEEIHLQLAGLEYIDADGPEPGVSGRPGIGERT